MKEFIEKLIGMLKESGKCYAKYSVNTEGVKSIPTHEAILIVNQLAEEYAKDQNWQTTRNYLDEKYFTKIRELSAKYNHPCENVPINFDWVFGLIDKMEMQLSEEYNNEFCE